MPRAGKFNRLAGVNFFANMRATLEGELAPVHEPGAEPDPTRYVPWDYALGYLDGLEGR